MNRRGFRRSAGGRDDRGAVAVELGLVILPLTGLLLGIVTMGLGYNKTLGVADGVREGARFGATTVSSSAWSASVHQRTIASTGLNTGSTTVVWPDMVCTKLGRASGTAAPGPTVWKTCTPSLVAQEPADPVVPAGTCLVKVWAQIPVVLRVILVPDQTIQVRRQSVSLYERGAC
jgi:Flp pilus assembly protein TadG